jgi:hypothetical protein
MTAETFADFNNWPSPDLTSAVVYVEAGDRSVAGGPLVRPARRSRDLRTAERRPRRSSRDQRGHAAVITDLAAAMSLLQAPDSYL